MFREPRAGTSQNAMRGVWVRRWWLKMATAFLALALLAAIWINWRWG